MATNVNVADTTDVRPQDDLQEQPPAPSDPPLPQVERVLAEATRDLEDADLMLLNPIRDALLQPALGLASKLLPPLTQVVPFSDAVLAWGLNIPFSVARVGYSLAHGHGNDTTHSAGDHVSEIRRTLVEETRLSRFVAEEIRSNCTDHLRTADLDQQFLAEQDGSFTFKNVLIDVTVVGSGNANGTTTATCTPCNLHSVVTEPIKLGKLPAIIFVNSWTCTEHEYIILAARLAKKGYIVMCYCTRGFGKSNGLVNVAGPKDRKDMKKVLDWLQDNTRADMTNVGIVGLSYGGGLSLIGAATQDRIKTAVALAGWADLAGSLYGNQSPRVVWGAFLVTSGYMLGEMDPIIQEKLAAILKHENIDDVVEWAGQRSAVTLVDEINAANKPIYLSNSFGDDLFNPNQAFRFFEKLTVPKRMDLNQGIHATPEGFGLLGGPNYVWKNVFDWFDYHLKGETNSVMDVQLTMELKLTNAPREEFSRWPSPHSTTRRFYLKPRGFFGNGTLSTSVNTDDNSSTTITSFPFGAAVSSGIPILSPFFEAHFHQAIPGTLQLNRFRSIVYYSRPLESTLKIRGHANLHLTVSSTISTAHIVVYLYDCKKENVGMGKLITHGVTTEYDMSTPNQEARRRLTIEIQATAYDVRRGHHLAIVIDLNDPLYSPPTRSLHRITVFHPAAPDDDDHERQSMLELQCVD